MDCSHLNDELAKLQTIIETSQSQLASKASLISKMELDIQRLNDLQSRSVNSPVFDLLCFLYIRFRSI